MVFHQCQYQKAYFQLRDPTLRDTPGTLAARVVSRFRGMPCKRWLQRLSLLQLKVRHQQVDLLKADFKIVAAF